MRFQNAVRNRYDWRGIARTLAIYLATLCPTAAMLAALIVSIFAAQRFPISKCLAVTAVYVLGFLGTAALGHLGATAILSAVRSKVLARRAWPVPVACGVGFSILVITGCVEQTTDVVERWVGHAHGDLLIAGSSTAWSALATAAVITVDRLLGRPKTMP